MSRVILSSTPTGAEAPKGNEGPPAAAVTPERPAWLPEKFKSAEEMATAYTEPEKKQGVKGTEGGNQPNTADPPAPSMKLDTTEGATAALAGKGLDFTALSNEFMAEGKLTDATMANLKSKGFTDTQVNDFIAGQQARARENANDVYSAVGGKARFDALQPFAVQSFSKAETEAYNAAVMRGDYASVKLMLSGLNAKFEARFGRDGHVNTGGVPNQKPDVFDNFNGYRVARKDPRYTNDPNFRDSVEKKLERSTFYKKSQ